MTVDYENDMRIFNAIFPKRNFSTETFIWYGDRTYLTVTVDWEQEG